MEDTIRTIDQPIRLEVRDLARRELHGRIMPFDKIIKVRGRDESFAVGAFADLDATATVLLSQHDPTKVVGRMTELEERADGAYATFRVAKTALGDEVLSLAADGIVDALSAGFLPGDVSSDGVHTRLAHLPEVSVVTWGAYPTAKVLSVRDVDAITTGINSPSTKGDNNMGNETEGQPLEASPDSQYEQRFADLGAQLTRLEATLAADATPPVEIRNEYTPTDWFVAQVEADLQGKPERRNAMMADLERRVLADATGTFGGATTTASGLVENNYLASQLVSVLDAYRPMMSAAGKLDMPHSGVALIPSVSQHTDVGVRPTQKAATTSRALRVIATSYTAKWYSGALDVAIELIKTAQFDVLALVFEDLKNRYAQVTEAAFIADLEAALTTDAVNGSLDVTSYATFAADVFLAAAQVRAGSGLPATQLVLPDAAWATVATFVDADGYRALNGSDRADAGIGFTQESFALPGGITVRPGGVTNGFIFNEASLKVAEDAPLKVESTNVELMGYDIGILGRTLVVPRILAGIVEFTTTI